MTPPRLSTQIIAHLKEREDIWLDDVASGPSIRGTKLIRFIETETRGPNTYHPFEYKGYRYIGQSFAIETDIAKTKTPFTKKQLEWRADYEACGGLYIEARTMTDVYEALGKARPEPWGAYEIRDSKVR